MLRLAPRPLPEPFLVDCARPGRKQVFLMKRNGQDIRVVEENGLGAVAVMNVPVDCRDPADAACLRMTDADRGIGEQQNPMAVSRSA